MNSRFNKKKNILWFINDVKGNLRKKCTSRKLFHEISVDNEFFSLLKEVINLSNQHHLSIAAFKVACLCL